MIRAATAGVRSRYQRTRTWLAADRRWAIATIALLALVIVSGGSEVDLTPIIIAAALVTVGIALVRSEAPTAPAREETSTAPAAPRARRPRSKLFPLTFAATLLALGVALVLDATTDLRLEPGRFTALALLMLGLGLLLGGWWGRARLLIPLGLLLVPVVLLSSLAEVDLSGRIGDFYEMPTTTDELPPAFDLLAGSATFDLTQLHLKGQDQHLRVEMGVGEIDVLLPHRFRSAISTDLSGGSIYVLGAQLDGTDLTISEIAHDDLRDQGTLTLNISGGVGSVAVEQVWAPRKDRGRREEPKHDRRDTAKKRDADNPRRGQSERRKGND